MRGVLPSRAARGGATLLVELFLCVSLRRPLSLSRCSALLFSRPAILLKALAKTSKRLAKLLSKQLKKPTTATRTRRNTATPFVPRANFARDEAIGAANRVVTGAR